jgi:hypothetical protein
MAQKPQGFSDLDFKYAQEQGYTIGGPETIPQEYIQYVGGNPNILGWKIKELGNNRTQLSVILPQGDEDGGVSFSTYGTVFGKNKEGKLLANPTAEMMGESSGFNAGSSDFSSNAANTATKTSFGPGTAGYTERRSAYDFLFEQFNQYGLGSLVEDIKGLIESNVSPSEFTIKLRETPAYKKRFAANAQRIAKGLRAIDEATYIGLEDQYQNVMRAYGLPASYYARGDMGIQQGFEKFIAGDVSAAELEDRIQTAQNRVINAAPEISRALREFYPSISNGDILAYALDPDKAITDIKRKVQAAEIGGAALQAGLATGLSRAEELQRYGVTGETARQGYQSIAGTLPRASTLGDIYAKQGMGPYTQTTAEQEVFGLPSAAEAATKRRKLGELEQAQFSGQAGVGALARERAGQF